MIISSIISALLLSPWLSCFVFKFMFSCFFIWFFFITCVYLLRFSISFSSRVIDCWCDFAMATLKSLIIPTADSPRSWHELLVSAHSSCDLFLLLLFLVWWRYFNCILNIFFPVILGDCFLYKSYRQSICLHSVCALSYFHGFWFQQWFDFWSIWSCWVSLEPLVSYWSLLVLPETVKGLSLVLNVGFVFVGRCSPYLYSPNALVFLRRTVSSLQA